jgi:hypothetical protein
MALNFVSENLIVIRQFRRIHISRISLSSQQWHDAIGTNTAYNCKTSVSKIAIDRQLATTSGPALG